jgi:hypothetical protein
MVWLVFTLLGTRFKSGRAGRHDTLPIVRQYFIRDTSFGPGAKHAKRRVWRSFAFRFLPGTGDLKSALWT